MTLPPSQDHEGEGRAATSLLDTPPDHPQGQWHVCARRRPLSRLTWVAARADAGANAAALMFVNGLGIGSVGGVPRVSLRGCTAPFSHPHNGLELCEVR